MGGGRGWGGGGSVWNLGSARGPFTAKKRSLFDENALKPHGPNQVRGTGSEGVGSRGVGPPWEGSVAPPESLDATGSFFARVGVCSATRL